MSVRGLDPRAESKLDELLEERHLSTSDLEFIDSLDRDRRDKGGLTTKQASAVHAVYARVFA